MWRGATIPLGFRGKRAAVSICGLAKSRPASAKAELSSLAFDPPLLNRGILPFLTVCPLKRRDLDADKATEAEPFLVLLSLEMEFESNVQVGNGVSVSGRIPRVYRYFT